MDPQVKRALEALEHAREQIDSDEKYTISIAMHVKSKKMGFKDILKIEDRELKAREVNKVSLISPNASVVIIKDQEVSKKYNVELPKIIKGIAKCSNPNCITNRGEPIETEFQVTNGKSIKLRCLYFDRNITDILASIV